MNEENTIIDQVKLAEDIGNHIKAEFLDYFLVKPLDPIKVKKEVSVPVAKEETKDSKGVEAADFDEVKTEIEEVDSDYRKGIVIKRPLHYSISKETPKELEIKVGDIVIFREMAGLKYDLLKDSRLIRHFDIVGIER